MGELCFWAVRALGTGQTQDLMAGSLLGSLHTLIDFKQNIHLSGRKTHSHFTIYYDDTKAIEEKGREFILLGSMYVFQAQSPEKAALSPVGL